MAVALSILMSFLALATTFYQAYLQRVHNVKSLKPLGQVDVGDVHKLIFVYITNNGMGPMIIERLVFTKNGNAHADIESCLDLPPQSYRHIVLSDTVKKTVLPNSRFEVFEMTFGEDHDSEQEMEHVKDQLAAITLTVHCRDVYDNKISFERNLEWFSRRNSGRIRIN